MATESGVWQQVATEFGDAFETRTRSDGVRFVALRKNEADRPEWLRGNSGDEVLNAIHSAIDDRFPDDWIFGRIAEIADDASHYDGRDEALDGIVAAPDVYTSSLIVWAADNFAAVDECFAEYNDTHSGEPTLHGLLEYAQGRMLDTLRSAVIEVITREADSRE